MLDKRTLSGRLATGKNNSVQVVYNFLAKPLGPVALIFLPSPLLQKTFYSQVGRSGLNPVQLDNLFRVIPAGEQTDL